MMESLMDTSDIDNRNLEEIIKSPAFECLKPTLIAFIEQELNSGSEYPAENEEESSCNVHDEGYGNSLYPTPDYSSQCNSPMEKLAANEKSGLMVTPDFEQIGVPSTISPDQRVEEGYNKEIRKTSRTRKPPRDPEHAEKCKRSRERHKSKILNLERREKELIVTNEKLRMEIEKIRNLRKNNLKIGVESSNYFSDMNIQMSSLDFF
ncbi:DgyrCDS5597 [Dimorphilus gyrociliatus]|uniref:DgyrCDS5597 n=1 Tax=Dimorphilus gyrociliatus TaxID=2664684 RepID=A0A7I8VQ66_9ANNE|nr:DgyrCDS5597 [Dimorphilus gyrociliatus]